MELKNYQKNVINDLNRFLTLLSEKQNIPEAYAALWEEKGIIVGYQGMPFYNMAIKGTPHVCVKVPTGGGKTFIAACAIKTIFDSMPSIHPRAVVWLVPSDAILQQTVNNLTNASHPYRQKIDVDFSGKVEVYTKDHLLNGQNFSPVSVEENLSIFILTYDSFRATKKEGRKAYQQNGNLATFNSFMNRKDMLLEDVDDTALIQVIRQLNPVIIVDESHHATSKLSIEMLENFNPCFVLDLTATPKEGSNIISFVDAKQLKKEEMIKLPVIVYNMKRQEDVYLSAISLRKHLEMKAIKHQQATGKYIRPIVLFQAQPKTSDDSTTYEKIKSTLIDIGIPEEEIAIKTAERDDIKTENLLSEDCKIRYIITVNALKEGWDCPFAYILATVANRNSVVDVEQILGRVLRLPYTKMSKEEELNLSYAITSSVDFYGTLEKVVKGLNNAGFSKKDYRVKNVDETSITDEVSDSETIQSTINTIMSDNINITSVTESIDIDEEPEINITDLKNQLDEILSANTMDDDDISIDDPANGILETAREENKLFWESITNESNTQNEGVPDELVEKMKTYRIQNEYAEEIEQLIIPQFVTKGSANLFTEYDLELVERETLRAGFTLQDKDTQIDFASIDAEIARVDVDEKDETPKAWQLKHYESEAIQQWFESQPSEKKRNLCKDRICKRLSKINSISDKEINDYVGRIMSQMNESQLTDLENNVELYADKIKKKVDDLLKEHEAKNFNLWLNQDRIKCEPMYKLPESISPITTLSSIPKSLYEEEDANMNDYEKRVIYNIANLENVKWWHRNISRKEFKINGAANAYPDFIIMLKSGKLLMVETKGDDRDNTDSKLKSESGYTWANLASMTGRLYKYYMVFETKSPDYQGSLSYDQFMEIIKEL